VWDAETFGARGILNGHTDTITGLAFSADGRRIVSGSADQTVRFWEPEAVRSESILATTGGEVRQIAINDDSTHAAVAQTDGAVRILSLSAMSPPLVCAGEPKTFLNSIAFGAGSHLLSTFWGLGASSIRVSDLSTCKTLATYGTRGAVVLATSPDGRRVAAGSSGGTLDVWDLNTGQQIWQADQKGWMRALAYSPDGRSNSRDHRPRHSRVGRRSAYAHSDNDRARCRHQGTRRQS
jgi:WD40 repeat protein